VSQVASDPTIHAHNPHLPRLTRPAQPSDRAPSPFESLIDDGPATAEQPTPAPTDNKVATADATQTSAKTNDSKAPAASDAAPTSKSDDSASVENPDNGKPACDTKVAANAKLVEGTTASDGSKTESDDKPADGQKSDKPALTTSPGIVQTTNSADAIAVTPTPAPVSNSVPVQVDQDSGPQQIALAAESGIQLKSPDPDTQKTVVGKQIDAGKHGDAGQQVDTGQPADEISDGSQPATKGPQQAHTDKPQFAVAESDKDHVAEARGEPVVNSHRGNSDSQAAVTADSSVTSAKIIADTGTQPTVQATTTHAASNAATPAALISQPGPQAAAIPLAGVALEIASKAVAGKNRFEIRLDPPELGRIEVRLDVDRDGNVTSRMTVDRADTLDLLRRDASGLERALQDAGLKTADNSLQFSLRDQSMGQQQTNAGPDAAQLIVTDETLPPIDVIPQNYARLAGTGGGLDIRV
jgi:flagellar hook-length control protein FliK